MVWQVSNAFIENPAEKLAALVSDELEVRVSPIALRLFIKAHWNEVSKLAHAIHGKPKGEIGDEKP